MLNTLSVRNYALIDSLEIDFTNGLSIITGETGAGKSILLGALSLILGQRADVAALKNKEDKCIIEGNFSLNGYKLKSFFKKNEIDYEDETIIRREITTSGKSRAFVNDTPVNLNVLRQLSLKLVDIHSQHQNLDLNESGFQLNIVDTFAGNSALLAEYKLKFTAYAQLKKELEELKSEASRLKDDFEYFQFQFDELEKAKLEEGEQEVLEGEQTKLGHSEEIQRNLALIYNLLSENEESVINSLNESAKAANQTVDFLPKIEDLSQRLDSTFIEVKDIASEVELLANEIQFDPERLEFVNERLDLLYTLQQKHKMDSVAGLIEIKDQLHEKINAIESFDDKLKELEATFDTYLEETKELAEQLTQKRQQSFSGIESYVTKQLHTLGMPNAAFEIAIEKLDVFSPQGKDKVSFLFSANKNGNIQNIAKVASGGEISRLMLSIKSLLSKSSGLPTIIFDEIDTGVSGEIADKMGDIMLKMSKKIQVINITHLPQVAAKGNSHYKVYKDEELDTTLTRIKKLNEEERLNEIAKMLSGKDLSQQALENAKVLLQNQTN